MTRHRNAAALVAFVVLTIATFGLVAVSAATPTVVRLHIGSDGKYFQFGTTRQNLTVAPSTCVVNSAEPVIDLSSTPTSTSPGLVGDALGVKSGGSNGTPCAQVDGTEALKMKPGTTMSGRTFTGVRLDLEMTGNAIAVLTLSRGTTSAVYQLQTGRSITAAQSSEPDYDLTAPYFVSSSPGDTTDACAAPNSSGPNSGSNDNCEWTVMSGFAFDTVSLVSSGGTVSLEGSNDFGNDPNFDSLLYVSNSAPQANNDAVSTAEDTPKSGNVLTNDTDADGNPLSASLLTNPSHGTLSFAANGAFTYTPAANYNGSDSFTYAASDGDLTSSATVTITITAVNDRPVATSQSVSTPEDQAITVTVATDVDSTVLTVSCTGAAGGTVHDNGNGSIVYTPAANFNGTVSLSCTATDDQGATTTTSATITVGVTPVNDPPVAYDDTGEVDQNSSAALDVVANDTDVDGDVLTPTAIGSITPAGATAVVNPDRTVTFTPPAGYTGPASFTYRANDGQQSSNVASVSLTVFPVLCSNDTVVDVDADTQGAFTRLSDPFECKRYSLEANTTDNFVLFQPTGSSTVTYRGFVQFGSDPAPAPGGGGGFTLLLRYDPTGGDTFQPVQWCIDPQFDSGGNVTSATLPGSERWCIASADTRPNSVGELVTVWQVYGRDDPKFTR